jgi:hypothetical protein
VPAEFLYGVPDLHWIHIPLGLWIQACKKGKKIIQAGKKDPLKKSEEISCFKKWIFFLEGWRLLLVAWKFWMEA